MTGRNMIYIIIGVILVGGAIGYFAVFKNKSIANHKPVANHKRSDIKPETAKPVIHQTKENNFTSLRDMAFKVTPDQLGFKLPVEQTVVYGLIMDWEMGNATASTVAYQSGDASLYLSSGGGVIGGGKHPNVNKAAKEFVSTAQTFLDQTTQTETTALPSADQVIFYLLTNKGTYLGKEQMENFENNTSPWIRLFEEGNKVLNELHQTSQ